MCLGGRGRGTPPPMHLIRPSSPSRMLPISSVSMQLLSLKVEYYFAPGSSTSCVDVVCINASLCINAACVYFAILQRNSLPRASTSASLTRRCGELTEAASVYKGILKCRAHGDQQLGVLAEILTQCCAEVAFCSQTNTVI